MQPRSPGELPYVCNLVNQLNPFQRLWIGVGCSDVGNRQTSSAGVPMAHLPAHLRALLDPRQA